MKSDLHHIRGSWSSSNSGRSNYPFADINDEDAKTWWGNNFTK